VAPRAPNRIATAGWALVVGWLASACEPELQVGARPIGEPECGVSSGGNAGLPSADKIIAVPWSTGFEEGWCDYARAGGFCYGDPDASYETVEVPVRAGRRAAAFAVTSDPARDGTQTRCFLEGALPVDAVYGAWFYLASGADNSGNWNLVHFRTGALPILDGIWDVSLRNGDDGGLFLYVRDFIRDTALIPDGAPEVPIGSWFHVEFRLRRAADASGEIALYQDGALLLEETSIVTDPADFAQWYVGNLADGLMPSESTLYVDDVTIRAAP